MIKKQSPSRETILNTIRLCGDFTIRTRMPNTEETLVLLNKMVVEGIIKLVGQSSGTRIYIMKPEAPKKKPPENYQITFSKVIKKKVIPPKGTKEYVHHLISEGRITYEESEVMLRKVNNRIIKLKRDLNKHGLSLMEIDRV